jgi:hypothetical protein
VRVTIENTMGDFTHKAMVEGAGVTADEVLQELLECMLGAGFQQESVKEAILGKAEEIEEDKTTE